MLVERCIASEGECDKLREKVTEHRRKLDDAQAALQELGRENQSLQVGWSWNWLERTNLYRKAAAGSG